MRERIMGMMRGARQISFRVREALDGTEKFIFWVGRCWYCAEQPNIEFIRKFLRDVSPLKWDPI